MPPNFYPHNLCIISRIFAFYCHCTSDSNHFNNPPKSNSDYRNMLNGPARRASAPGPIWNGPARRDSDPGPGPGGPGQLHFVPLAEIKSPP